TALWIASVAVPSPARYAMWAAGLVIDAAATVSDRPDGRLPLNVGHLRERLELLVLIVLGESVVRLVSAARERSGAVWLAVALAASFSVTAVLWWFWLRALAVPTAHVSGPGYLLLNLPLVLGIAAASAGLHIAILAAHDGGTIHTPARIALYGGVALFLLAAACLPASGISPYERSVRLGAAAASAGLLVLRPP